MSPNSVPTLLDQGDPLAEPRSFRRCLGQFATGVAVIIARGAGGELGGVTVNSFSSVSLDPPLVLWSIKRSSRSLETFLTAPRFSVNILAADQIAASRHFSSAVQDKFADVELVHGLFDVPLLAGAVAYFECRREDVLAGGDHEILVGRVERFARYDGKPLLFVQGQYGVAGPHPDLPAEQSKAPTESGRGAEVGSEDLTALIFDARNRLSARFDQHRSAEGIALPEGRVLRRVAEQPGIDRERLLAITFLGERDLDDAVAALEARGWLRDSGGGYELTGEGWHRRASIRERWQAFQAEQVAGIPEADMQATLRVLERLIGTN